MNVLQLGSDLFRLVLLNPLVQPTQNLFHPQGFHPFPALFAVVQQWYVLVVFDAQLAMVDAPIHLAGALVSGQVA
jgi:hypothetical protein